MTVQNISKQSAGQAICSEHNKFSRAVIKLSALYSFIFFIILLAFSAIVYLRFVERLPESVNVHEFLSQPENEDEELGDEAEESLENHIVESAIGNLLDNLIATDIFLTILVVFVSYFLAKRTLAPLRKSDENQRRFMSDVAHELRTPLAVMKASIEVGLVRKRDSNEYERFMRDTLEEINFMISMTNDLLYNAKNENSIEHTFSKINFSEILEAEIDMMHAYALSTQNVSIEKNIEKNIFISGYVFDLKRLIANILKNAIDYNKGGGSVSVSLKKGIGLVKLTITDTGIGIKKEDISKVFNRFYRADTSRTKSKGSSGTGIGLHIVKQIIELHKGKIYLESTENVGTTIFITLPLLS